MLLLEEEQEQEQKIIGSRYKHVQLWGRETED